MITSGERDSKEKTVSKEKGKKRGRKGVSYMSPF
jgi:hypothetical protein